MMGFHEIKEPENLRKNEEISVIVDEARKFILANFEREISLTLVAEKIKINPNYLSSLFRQEMGYTFTNYITLLRLSKAKELLKNTNESITHIANQVGYLDSKHFYKVFKKWVNKTPLEFRASKND
jgi:two-component system response regulator YesN